MHLAKMTKLTKFLLFIASPALSLAPHYTLASISSYDSKIMRERELFMDVHLYKKGQNCVR